MATGLGQIESAFNAALSGESAAVPAGRAPENKSEGRKLDKQSFLMATSRIRRNQSQVRQRGKSSDDAEVQELAKSMGERGQMNPIGIRWIGEDEIWEVVHGDCRFVAATEILGWEYIRVTIVEASDEELLWDQLHENIHRSGLHPLDLAQALEKAIDSGMSPKQVAKNLAKSESYVTKALRVARDLSPEAREHLEKSPKGRSLDTAYEVSKIPPKDQPAVAEEIARKDLNQREVRRLVAATRETSGDKGQTNRGRKPQPKPVNRTWDLPGGVKVTVESPGAVSTKEIASALKCVLKTLRKAS